MGSRKKNSHVMAAMIRGYGCKGYCLSAMKLFLHARERNLEHDSKDHEYKYLCYQAALDWALNNKNSYMIYTVLRYIGDTIIYSHKEAAYVICGGVAYRYGYAVVFSSNSTN